MSRYSLNRHDRKIAGVCSTLGDVFNIDPTVLRIGFVAAAFLARLGSRIGLPTIPLFILAGILLGPHTPGYVLVEDPHDLEMLSALGLVLLLFGLPLLTLSYVILRNEEVAP